ncbi:thiamine pyrophosphokinase [Polycladomyces abyssicola]|uniref:Thiamine diphosphokinase n=1 Tax=Polycladomyces abyssicola TaxID=1125966 RepID=A0A8D5UHW1_9BACL|nr:thiamine diphosphokinase [Polycladomyces abyssicola]BCU82180.1 thiamine pyrophosphokinase [Polycladomyces abyssicola]
MNGKWHGTGRVVIVTGGSIDNGDFSAIRPDDVVIGVDGGAVRLWEAGVRIDLAVGDFDTAGEDFLHRLRESSVPTRRLPAEKDLTDTQYAVEQALMHDPQEILVLGALGGTRFDHTWANVGLLERIADRGSVGIIQNRWNRLRLMKGSGSLVLPRDRYTFCSLLPVSEEVSGVTLTGFRYPLKEATLKRGDTWGISNEWEADRAVIVIRSGVLLVVESNDASDV